MSDWFAVESGVRQGCRIAPDLFLGPMDHVMERTVHRGIWTLRMMFFFASRNVGSPCSRTGSYQTYIVPVLMYGCETWATTKYLLSRLDAFETSRLGHYARS